MTAAVVALAQLCVVLAVTTLALWRRLREMEGQLGRAEHDAVTGLWCRGAWMARAEAALLDAPGVLLVLDLDRFKAVNDACGHLVGDYVLAVVGARLSGHFGPGALVGRLGGDEFVVLLPGEPVDLDVLVTRICEPVEIDRHYVSVGVSIGIAEARRRERIDDVVNAADYAMYEAKRRQHGPAYRRAAARRSPRPVTTTAARHTATG